MSDMQPTDSSAPQAPGYAAGIFFLVWAGMGWFAILSNAAILKSLNSPGLDPGPGALPVMVCTSLSLGGFWLLMSGVMRTDVGMESTSFRALLVPGGFIVSAFVATFFMDAVGFRISGYIFAVLWLYLLGGSQRIWWRRGGKALVLGILIVGAIEVVFVQFLRVPLP